MKYILDLVIVALIIGCAIGGSRKGAVRMLITVAGYIVAVAAATFISNVASEYVYENVVKPYVISALETKAESLEDEFLSPRKINRIFEQNGIVLSEEQLASIKDNSEQYKELLDNEKIREDLNDLFKEYCESMTSALNGIVPEEIIEEAERYLDESNLETDRMLMLVTYEKETIIKIIEKEIIKPVMMRTVKFVLFAVTFAVVALIATIVSYIAKLIRKIPVVSSADSFLGTMIGLLQGLLYTAIVNLGVNMFIELTSDTNAYLNTTIISETYAFGFLYNATFYLIALILN